MTTNPEDHTPKVSIGMPVFNGEKYIRETLDSLLAQTFTDFELIISDNASTDATEAICREYAAKDARIRYVRQLENRGARFNFQFVLGEARGEYFMWAAADDTWDKKFLSTCISMLGADQAIGMAMTAYRACSRFSSLFDRKFDDVLDVITLESRFERVMRYVEKPFSSHKDNLTYAVWRRVNLIHIQKQISLSLKLPIRYGAMNEYALSLYQGGYSNEVLFYKRYRYVPPGHTFSPLFDHLSKIKRNVLGQKIASTLSSPDINEIMHDINTLLKLSGFENEQIDEISRVANRLR